jgi:hypothetical protein
MGMIEVSSTYYRLGVLFAMFAIREIVWNPNNKRSLDEGRTACDAFFEQCVRLNHQTDDITR